MKNKIREKIWESLKGFYYCDRVWEAWQYGTMTENDFYPAEDSDDMIEELVEEIETIVKNGRPPLMKTCPECNGKQSLCINWDGECTLQEQICHDGVGFCENYSPQECLTCNGQGEVPNRLTPVQYTQWKHENGYPDFELPEEFPVYRYFNSRIDKGWKLCYGYNFKDESPLSMETKSIIAEPEHGRPDKDWRIS